MDERIINTLESTGQIRHTAKTVLQSTFKSNTYICGTINNATYIYNKKRSTVEMYRCEHS